MLLPEYLESSLNNRERERDGDMVCLELCIFLLCCTYSPLLGPLVVGSLHWLWWCLVVCRGWMIAFCWLIVFVLLLAACDASFFYCIYRMYFFKHSVSISPLKNLKKLCISSTENICSLCSKARQCTFDFVCFRFFYWFYYYCCCVFSFLFVFKFLFVYFLIALLPSNDKKYI